MKRPQFLRTAFLHLFAKSKSRSARPWDGSEHRLASVQPLEDRLMLSGTGTITLDLDTTDTAPQGDPEPTGFETTFNEDSTDAIEVTSGNVDIDLGSAAPDPIPVDQSDPPDFPEGFESGLPSGWLSAGAPSFVDIAGDGMLRLASENPGVNDRVTTRTIDLTNVPDGYTGVRITFSLSSSSVDAGQLQLRYVDSANGISQAGLIAATGGNQDADGVIELTNTNVFHSNFRFDIGAIGGVDRDEFWLIDDLQFEWFAEGGTGSGNVDSATVTIAGFSLTDTDISVDMDGVYTLVNGEETITFEIPSSNIAALELDNLDPDYSFADTPGGLAITFVGSDTDLVYETLFQEFRYLTTEQDSAGMPTRDITFQVTSDGVMSNLATSTITLLPDANNVDPTLSVTADGSIGLVAAGEPFTFTGTFFDPESLDTHEISVDWGDGTVETNADANVSLDQLAGTVGGSHVYTEGGIYEVVITLTDDDGGTDSFTTQVFVTGVGVQDGTLQIIGDNERNKVFVHVRTGEYRVATNFSGVDTFAVGDVEAIEIYTGGGNDFVLVSNRVDADVPVFIDAGDGDDLVIGGAGDDVIVGGDGDDMLFGRNGNDVIVADGGNDLLVGGSGDDLMVGGEGSDALLGNRGNDLLIGGTTSLTTDELVTLLDQWMDGYDEAAVAAALEPNVMDDGEFDLLIGGAGDDLTFTESWFC